MSRKINEQDFESLKLIIKRFPRGCSIEEIMFALNAPIPLRTLQRRLSTLITNGEIKSEGKARARKYLSQETENKIAVEANLVQQIIPLSPKAKSILSLVSQPIQARTHVGYKREFLDRYKPNQTYYLSEEIRRHLFEIGQSHDGERPAGTYARQILGRLLIDLSWNSSRLEGNTYSLLETEQLLELGAVTNAKDFKEAQMILNHKAAIEFLVESIEDIGIDKFTISNLHALLSHNLLGNPAACGSLRTIPVGIAKTVYHPLSVPHLIEQYFLQILDKARTISDAFEQAFFLMVHIPYLQPFEDVNKRVSRLAANISLIRENLCPLSFIDVPKDIYIAGLLSIYELNCIELMQDVFIWAYERSCSIYSVTRSTLGEPDLFRIRYRELIKATIIEIVKGCMDRVSAVKTIKQQAENEIPPIDQAQFIEVVEREIMSLHEGNIARYQLRRVEFETWQQRWR